MGQHAEYGIARGEPLPVERRRNPSAARMAKRGVLRASRRAGCPQQASARRQGLAPSLRAGWFGSLIGRGGEERFSGLPGTGKSPTTRRPTGSRRGAFMGQWAERLPGFHRRRGRSGARAGAGESLRLTRESLSVKRASCSKIPRIRACPRRPRLAPPNGPPVQVPAVGWWSSRIGLVGCERFSGLPGTGKSPTARRYKYRRLVGGHR
jgi:hypothetical protein